MMRRLALLTAILLAPAAARADRYDFRLFQLGAPATDPSANLRFNAFMNELGVAICNWNLEPPETTGYAGFNFAFSSANRSGACSASCSKSSPLPQTHTGSPAFSDSGHAAVRFAGSS